MKLSAHIAKKAFKIDEAGYADILKQVRDREFEQTLHERLEDAERDKVSAVLLAEEKTKNQLQAESAKKDALIAELRAGKDSLIAELRSKQDKDLAELTFTKDTEIAKLNSRIDAAETDKVNGFTIFEKSRYNTNYMKEVILSTGNKMKLREATEACAPFGISIIHKDLDIDEIQSHEPLKIAIHKAKETYKITSRPVVINDSFWEIPALNGFPGGYMKDIIRWFSANDFINLMQNKADRRVCLTECIVYRDETTEKIITKNYCGEIAKKPAGTGNALEQVTVFNGMTMGEYHQQGKLVFDIKDYIWNDFAEWFSKYDK